MAKKKTGNAAQNIADELYCFKIDEAFESDQDTIAFFWLCIYENYMDQAAKYDKVDVSKLNDEILSAFPHGTSKRTGKKTISLPAVLPIEMHLAVRRYFGCITAIWAGC